MKTLKVALGFDRLSDGALSALANTVFTNMAGIAAYNKPPVTYADASKGLDTFDKSVAAAMDGGTALTAAKKADREALIAILRKLAAYVQIVADGDMALLLSSGFSAVTPGRAPAKLAVPTILSVDNEGTTKLNVRLHPVANARAYQVRASLGNNGTTTWLPTVDSTQTRRIIVGNLVPGTTYSFQARAIGGSDGYSEWSDPVSHMAI